MGSLQLFDSHCHLQDSKISGNLEMILVRARDAGVIRLLCCGSTEEDWYAVSEIYYKHKDRVVPAFGIHPWYVGERSKRWIENLETFLKEIPEAAVGEIGLDFSISNCDKAEQQIVFIEQLRLAQQYKRAISVHCRKAWSELVAIAKKEIGVLNGAVIHCYSGSAEMIEILLKTGFSFSFSASITNPNNKRGRTSLEKVPLDHLLIETDSPDIAPFGWTGFNEPANLVQVARQVAEIRGLSLEKVGEITAQNANKLFNLKSDSS